MAARSVIDRLQLTPDLPNSSLKLTADTSGPAGLDVEALYASGR